MATLYVAEFPEGSFVQGVTMAKVEPIAEQTAAIGGTSTAVTNPFNRATSIIRIHTDAICSIVFGVTPTAAATNMRLAANQTEYFRVPANKDYKVAVITNT